MSPELSERAIQARVRRLYLDTGCEVYSTSSVNRSRIAKGFPDFWVMRTGKGGWFHELKKPGGKQSPAQVAFQHSCERAGVTYLCGGLDVAVEHLRQIGLLSQQYKPPINWLTKMDAMQRATYP